MASKKNRLKGRDSRSQLWRRIIMLVTVATMIWVTIAVLTGAITGRYELLEKLWPAAGPVLVLIVREALAGMSGRLRRASAAEEEDRRKQAVSTPNARAATGERLNSRRERLRPPGQNDPSPLVGKSKAVTLEEASGSPRATPASHSPTS